MVTVTSTVPEPAGLVAVISLGDSTLTPVAAPEANLTALAPVRLLPLIVTAVAPAAGPELGSTLETVGGTT